MTLEILGQTVYSEEENIIHETVEVVQLGEKIDKHDIFETDVSKLQEKHVRKERLIKVTNLRNEFKHIRDIATYIIEEDTLDKVIISNNNNISTLKEYVTYQNMISAIDTYTALDMTTVVKLGLKDCLKNKFNITDNAVNYLNREVIIFRQINTGNIICHNENYIIEIADVRIQLMVHASSFRPAEDLSTEKFTEITKFIRDYTRDTKHTMLRLYTIKNLKIKGENEA